MMDDGADLAQAVVADDMAMETVVIPADKVEVRVLVARDRMEATLQINIPPGSPSLEMDELLMMVQKSGVVVGLDHEYIKKAYDYPGISVICARGKEGISGNNAYIKYHIDMKKHGCPNQLADGSVDFKNLNLFTVVQQGDVLAEKIPATLGTPGIDVLGNVINPKKGKDIPLPVGKNVQIANSTSLAATMAGQVIIANNKINVIPVVEIAGDVDVSTGNIEFCGGFIVRGSVQPGFSVKADGNVEILGTVSGGTVEGKNVIIKMGIQGMHRGYVKAKENVAAKFIENATVYAGIDILVSDVLLHSKINASKRVLVEGRRGLIVGGRVMAGEEIRAKVVGTQMATMTSLEVGVNPILREEYQQLRDEMKKTSMNLEKTKKALSILRSMDQNVMSPEKKRDAFKINQGSIPFWKEDPVELDSSLTL